MDYSDNVVCPACQPDQTERDYNHLTKIIFENRKVSMEFDCENGHHWGRFFEFRKGITYCEDRLLKDLQGEPLNFKPIWRD